MWSPAGSAGRAAVRFGKSLALCRKMAVAVTATRTKASPMAARSWPCGVDSEGGCGAGVVGWQPEESDPGRQGDEPEEGVLQQFEPVAEPLVADGEEGECAQGEEGADEAPLAGPVLLFLPLEPQGSGEIEGRRRFPRRPPRRARHWPRGATPCPPIQSTSGIGRNGRGRPGSGRRRWPCPAR